MSNQTVKEFIQLLFDKVQSARTIGDVDAISMNADLNKLADLEKNKMDDKTYPALQFSIMQAEIDSLKQRGLLTEENTFPQNTSGRDFDPLTKLLYAIVWKNGDLKKVKHIVQGITAKNAPIEDKNDGLIFYQFGKYLTKTPGEPIVDQHVLRAFGIYKANNEAQISGLRRMSLITKTEKSLIKQYKEWLVSNEITSALKAEENYVYHIDKLLFAAGKTVKQKKKI